MPFWQLYYHIVWATADHQPLIVPEIESDIYNTIKDKASALGGEVFIINGIADHVHIAIAIPPHISISDLVGEIKGASSYHINHSIDNPYTIYWQRGYGVVSFRKSNLQQVVEYIKKQKEHHSCGKIWQSLEDCGDKDLPNGILIREEQLLYDPYA